MTTAVFKDIEKLILINLQKANSNIKVAVAWFTNPVLFQVLLEKRIEGKNVELILSDDKINFTNKGIDFQNFIDLDGGIHISKFPHLMHHKFCVIDGRLLISGSYNWTKSAELRNLENVIVSTDLGLINQFIEEFDKIKERTEKVISIDKIELHEYSTDINRQQEFDLLVLTTQESNNTSLKEEVLLAAEIDPIIESLFEEANQFYFKGKYEAALKLIDKILNIRIDISDVYELIATIKWRQKKFKEQIEFAHKAIEIDNLFFPAYNILGIGYSKIGNAQKSIESYKICIEKEPENYIYFKNRAVSYIELEDDLNVPTSLRSQFKKKADEDLNVAINLTNRYENEHDDYMLYYTKGSAKFLLGKIKSAKNDLLKALEKYNNLQKNEQDIHILREIKLVLKEVERIEKA